MTEFDQKQARLQVLLDERQLDALLLRRVSNVTWATCGARVYVNIATDRACAMLFISKSSRLLITDNLEAERFLREELLDKQGWELRVSPWYEGADPAADLTHGLRLGTDWPYRGATDVSSDLTHMRTQFTPEEADRFRVLGRLCAEAVQATAQSLRPGQTEQAISARLGYEAELCGVQAVTNIVATDWRIAAFRHALPTDKPLDRYAMLVLNGRRWGLVSTVTRFVHFGPLPDEVRTHHALTAQIAAQLIHATRPGVVLSDLFQMAVSAYAQAGYPGEWQKHHQGGALGYEPREFLITAQSSGRVSAGQAYIWNPSIESARSVDPFLVGPSGNEILATLPEWPVLPIRIHDRVYARPAVLEID
jgi:Xaa-Pro aminopeptidase